MPSRIPSSRALATAASVSIGADDAVMVGGGARDWAGAGPVEVDDVGGADVLACWVEDVGGADVLAG